LAGQITARAEQTGNYYTQRLGLGFDEITASNLLEVNEDLVVLSGDGIANPANRFHTWIYRALLLTHHGLIIACRSVEEACSMALQCERAAQLQMLAEFAGSIQDIALELGREAHDWILQEKRSQATFAYYARRLLRQFDNPTDYPLS